MHHYGDRDYQAHKKKIIVKEKCENRNERELLRQIEAGRFKNDYFIYNRRSIDEPDSQKNSIAYQKAENARFAMRQKLSLAPITLAGFCTDGIVSEKHSGFKESGEIRISENGLVQFSIDRPKFKRLVRFLSLGLFKGVIVLCWDRISRNKGDDTVLDKLMRKGIDVQFAFATYDDTSSGALHMDIDGMFARHHSRVTSEKVRTATWNLRERGICTYRAPIGYLNTGKMEHKPFDPERAPVIKRLFELYETGDWSLEDLARYANKAGLKTIPMRRRRTEDERLAEEDEEVSIVPVSRPITANMVHKILNNPFYTGRVLGNDQQYIPSISHVPLISDKTFAEVRRLLHSKQTSTHYTDKLDLFYRGMVRCADCKRVYTPYIQKGIQYFRARCASGCGNGKKNFNIGYLESKLNEILAGLYFTPEELAGLDAQVEDGLTVFEKRRRTGLDENERKKKAIREDLDYLRENRLPLLKAGVYTPQSFMEEEDQLNRTLSRLQEEETLSDAAIHEVVKEIVMLSELLKTASILCINAESDVKEKLCRIVFTELSLSENALEYKVKKGFQPFETRLASMCDPTAWLTELCAKKEFVNGATQELKSI